MGSGIDMHGLYIPEQNRLARKEAAVLEILPLAFKGTAVVESGYYQLHDLIRIHGEGQDNSPFSRYAPSLFGPCMLSWTPLRRSLRSVVVGVVCLSGTL
jgi:hypothetical protein